MEENRKIYISESGNDYLLSDKVGIILMGDCYEKSMMVSQWIGGCLVYGIGDYAFGRCIQLEQVYISNGITFIGRNPFRELPRLKKICVLEGNERLISQDGVLMDAVDRRIICCPQKGAPQSFSVPRGMRQIGDHAFHRCRGLKQIGIPDSVVAIGKSAFGYCTGLTAVHIPSSVVFIGRHAFRFCHDLREIVIAGRIKEIKDHTFYGCCELRQVTVPEGVVEIGNVAFYGCIQLQTVTLPEGIERLKAGAFGNCKRLLSINLPESIKEIEGRAVFRGSTKLTATVCKGSYAEAYCREHRINFVYSDPTDAEKSAENDTET